MIFKRNNINIGLGLGMFFPLVLFLLFKTIFQATNLPLKMRTVALIAICLNLVFVQIFNKYRANNSIRGLVLATVGLAVVWFVWFGQEIWAELE